MIDISMVKKRLVELSLDEDVLYRIFNQCSLRDTIRMGAVCKSWRSVSKWSTRTRHQLPWLMMLWDPNAKNENHVPQHSWLETIPKSIKEALADKALEFRCFFTLSDNTMYGPIKFLGLDGKRCCGSFSNANARGWLMTIFDVNGDMQLFHPWHGIQLQLPNHSTLPFSLPFGGRFWAIGDLRCQPTKRLKRSRAAMSDDASTVAVITDSSCELAFCRIGDEVWTRVVLDNECYGDVIYHKGQFYVVTWNGRVGVLRTNTTNPYIEILTEPILDDRFETYLVGDSTSGSIFILRTVKTSVTEFKVKCPWTIGFLVYELRLEETGEYMRKPLEVDRLGDRVIFLGRNSSMLIMVSQFPGFQGNRIYFTDMRLESYVLGIPFGCIDFGIFSMEDKTVRRPPEFLNRAIHSYSPPIWIAPCPAL